MSDLLPCPFCGGTDLSNERASVLCDCGVIYRPLVGTNQAAALFWNRRTPPPGYRLVPVEPTESIIAAGCKAFERSSGEDGGVYFFSLKDMKAAYLAMLDAAEDSRE